MKTVKVKIAVSVDSNGDWSAAGWSGGTDPSEFHSYTIDALEPGENGYWLEAELPVPEKIPTIQATVTEAGTP